LFVQESTIYTIAIEELTTAAKKVEFPKELVDGIFEVVSKGTINLQYSDCFRIHGSTSSW